MPRGALRLTYRADDDHGVASAEARFALAETEASTLPAPRQPAVKNTDAAKTRHEAVVPCSHRR